MKKSELPAIQPMTEAEIATRTAEQSRYIPMLSQVAAGTYHFEVNDEKKINVYPVPYVGNDGVQRTYDAFCLAETGDLISTSSFVERGILAGGQLFISKGFYPTSESLTVCRDTLNALADDKRGFVLTHKVGVWADGGRRKGTKPIVTPL